MLDAETKRAAEARLRKIAGQVEGLQRMLSQDRYCVDVLLQIAAVQAALGRVGSIVLGSHVETCVTEAFASGTKQARREKIDELMDVFSRYAQLRPR